MARFVRRFGIVALALAAACSKGGSGNAGSSGSSADTAVKSADGVVASVKSNDVQVKTKDGRVLQFKMKDETKVTLGGGEASHAVVSEGAPVRVAYKGDEQKPEVVSVDVEPAVRGGSGEGKPPAAGRFDAEAGNQGDAHAKPPTYDSGRK
jgi:ABC-type Fe3+-hydroxamate transport system substrate-binding protein